MNAKEVKDCFSNARNDEKKGKKHKGLLLIKSDEKRAREYLAKAKMNLELCNLYKEKGYEYKIPEEWFYTLYYCALAILSRLGVESRSQKCTAVFLKYIKEKSLIEYDDEFIDRITVYKEKEEVSDVDEREKARYSSSIKSEEITSKYNYMENICKRAISQCEAIIFDGKRYEVPAEIWK